MVDLLLLATLFVLAGCLGLVVLTTAVRLSTLGAAARRSALRAPLRALLLQLVAGDDDEVAAAKAALLRLPARRWRDVEPVAIEFLARVKGEPHAQLVDLLRRREVLARLASELYARRAHRRARAAWVLGTAQYGPAVASVADLLDDPSADVRRVAIRVLGRLGGPAEASVLFDVLRRGTAPSWTLTVDALRRIGRGSAPTVLAGLADGSPAVRAAAAFLAGVHGLPAAAGPLVGQVTGDSTPRVRAYAVRALGRVGSPAVALPPLVRAAWSDHAAEVRLAALEGIAALGGPKAVAALVRLCAHRDLRVAREASRRLVRLGETVRPALDAVAFDAGPSALALTRTRLGLGPGGDPATGRTDQATASAVAAG